MTRLAAVLTLATSTVPAAATVDGLAERMVYGVDHRLLDAWLELSGSNRPSRRPSAPVPRLPGVVVPAGSPDASGWADLVGLFFPPGRVDAALSVLYCESGGDASAVNPSSGAAGLFQVMPQWYSGEGFTSPSPYGRFDPFNPAENVSFAAWLSDDGSDWSAWVCQP